MKKLFLPLLFLALLIAANNAQASDFGDFFSGEAPAALGGDGYSDLETISFQDPSELFFDIEPAAGDFDAGKEVDSNPKARKYHPDSKYSVRAPRITEDNAYFIRKRSGE